MGWDSYGFVLLKKIKATGTSNWYPKQAGDAVVYHNRQPHKVNGCFGSVGFFTIGGVGNAWASDMGRAGTVECPVMAGFKYSIINTSIKVK